jgi:hypothetical protein
MLPQGISQEKLPQAIYAHNPFPFVPERFYPHFLEMVKEGDTIRIYGQLPMTYLYASYWNPPRQYHVLAQYPEHMQR